MPFHFYPAKHSASFCTKTLIDPSVLSSQYVWYVHLPSILNSLHNRWHNIRPKHNHSHDRKVPIHHDMSASATLFPLFSHHTSISPPCNHPSCQTHQRKGKDSHHHTPPNLLPLRTPSRLSLRTTRTRSSRHSICPKLLDRRSLDPGSCECREHWASSERRHCLLRVGLSGDLCV